MRDAGAALRAAAYDAAYWNERYAKDGGAFEWFVAPIGSGVDAEAACGAEAQLAQAVRAALGEAIPKRVLDLGCGTSELAAALAARGHELTAVDYARAAVSAAQARAKRRREAAAGPALPPAPVYAVADATALPFRDGVFDAVLDKGTLDSLNCVGAAEAAAAESARVLPPGGLLLSVTCRDCDERVAMLAAAGFAQAAPPVGLYTEPAAPCPNASVLTLRRT